MESGVIIGVDGGGTHARLVAVRKDGAVLARGEGGGLNYNSIPLETVRRNLRKAVDDLCGCAGICGVEAISIGMSALDARADAAARRTFAGDVFDAEQLLMDSDVYAAMLGARLGQPCVMVISGTGSMVVGIDQEDRTYVSGGWGYRLGDPGGGYGIAVHALQEVLKSLEGYGPRTSMTDSAFGYFEVANDRDLINGIYGSDADTPYIAGFAKMVLRDAENGDPIAAKVADEQLGILAHQTYAVYRDCPGCVCMYGGVFEHSAYAKEAFMRMLLDMDGSVEFAEPMLPPELGAVIMYLKSVNGVTKDVLEKMQKTWRSVQHDGN